MTFIGMVYDNPQSVVTRWCSSLSAVYTGGCTMAKDCGCDCHWARLDDRIEKRPDGCWVWTAALHVNGYGAIRWEGRQDYVHRVMYRRLVGSIPAGMAIDHLCRNRACCNPDHLEAVTHRVNILRGTGTGARNAVKTECLRGHPFDEENTYWTKGGGRSCRVCIVDRGREYRARKGATT